jgi:hypothetical protein
MPPAQDRPGPDDPPFDIGALDRVLSGEASGRTRRGPWWRRRRDPEPPPALLNDARPTAAQASLVLVPDEAHAEHLAVALRRAGAPTTTRPRVVLRAEVPLLTRETWEPTVASTARCLAPFEVRLGPPEILHGRVLGLPARGRGVTELRDALDEQLAACGLPAPVGDRLPPVVRVGSTFDGLTVSELHALSTAVRDEQEFPLEFEARALFAYGEAATEYDLPLMRYPLGG